MIKMTHPLHGEMHVYLDAEAVENEKNGWVMVADIVAHETAQVSQQAQESHQRNSQESAVPFRRRPGRPRKETEDIL